MTPALAAHVLNYGDAHQHPVNIGLHLVGIPALLVASLGLLAQVAAPVNGLTAALRPNLGWVALFVACVWYLYFDWKVGLLAWVGWLAAYVAGCAMPAGLLVAVFAGGSLTQIVGHFVFERNLPVFLGRPVSALESPAWLLTAPGRTLAEPG